MSALPAGVLKNINEKYEFNREQKANFTKAYLTAAEKRLEGFLYKLHVIAMKDASFFSGSDFDLRIDFECEQNQFARLLSRLANTGDQKAQFNHLLSVVGKPEGQRHDNFDSIIFSKHLYFIYTDVPAYPVYAYKIALDRI